MDTEAENTLPEDLQARAHIATGDAPETDTGEATPPELTVSPLAASIAHGVISGANVLVCPNWTLSSAERDMLAEPLGQIITAWLPTDPDATPSPYVALIIAATVVAASHAGEPMRLKEVKEEREQPRAAMTRPEPMDFPGMAS